MNIRDLAKSKTTHREQRLIARCTSRIHFATSAHIQDKLNFGGHVSVRTANTDGRSHDHLHWNICYWKPLSYPCRTFKSNLQLKEQHPQTVTP
jgi:hypothetical protein